MKLFEIADQTDREQVIRKSFDDRVVSDVLADVAQKGDIVDSNQVIANIRKQFPELKDVQLEVSKEADRVRIYFSPDGKGEKIILPPQLKDELGEILVLHEIAHMLYTKDILTDTIITHKAGPQAFTILRVLEDISIEKRLEKEYPQAVEVFKQRAKHIIPAYFKSDHVPSKFAKEVDDLFLYLRGYAGTYKGDPYLLRYAQQYLETDSKNVKIDAILNLVSRIPTK